MLPTKRITRSITTADKSPSTPSTKRFDPELQMLPKRSFKFQSFTTKATEKQQRLTVDKLVEKLIIALDHYYTDDESGFYKTCKEFLTKGWDSWKLKIIDRMNTYEFIEMAIKHKNYCDIEAQLLTQWKKNYLLFGIMTFWYDSTRKLTFKSSNQFKSRYIIHREFISQVSYFIFKGWFTCLQKRNVSVLDKLFQETSHFIVTSSSQFKKVYEKALHPLILNQIKYQKVNWEFDLDNLHLKKCIYNQKKQENLPRTIEVMKKFSQQLKLSKKIQLLRKIRKTLQEEIIQNQKQEIQANQKISIQILQKDDFLSALIYCIICGQIYEIQSAMKYLTMLLGQGLDLLSKMQLGPYAIDLIASIDYLSDQKNYDQSELIIHSVMDKRLKIQSTPLIWESKKQSEFGQGGNKKKNTTQIEKNNSFQ